MPPTGLMIEEQKPTNVSSGALKLKGSNQSHAGCAPTHLDHFILPLFHATELVGKGASEKDVTCDAGGVGSMRSVTYCERDVTYGGGGGAERDKGFFFAREMRYRCCPETKPPIEIFHGVAGSTSRLELGLCGLESWREHLFLHAYFSFRARNSRVVLVHLIKFSCGC